MTFSVAPLSRHRWTAWRNAALLIGLLCIGLVHPPQALALSATTGDIAGTVTSAASGNPLRNFVVTASWWAGEWWEQRGHTQTDEIDGRYTFSDLDEGVYRVCFFGS